MCALVTGVQTCALPTYSVTAQELKQEEMIKLPIILSENDSWQNAVNGSVAARASLAETAEADRDYIRPIVLFQAQQRDQEVTVEVLKKHLIETENIPAEKIAVATGDQRGLDGIDLFDPACPIEHVITMEDRKSVVSGKSVSVGVDPGGRRII